MTSKSLPLDDAIDKIESDIAASEAAVLLARKRRDDDGASAVMAGKAPPPATGLVDAQEHVVQLRGILAALTAKRVAEQLAANMCTLTAGVAEADVIAAEYQAEVRQLGAMLQVLMHRWSLVTRQPSQALVHILRQPECTVHPEAKRPHLERLLKIHNSLADAGYGRALDFDQLLKTPNPDADDRVVARAQLNAVLEG